MNTKEDGLEQTCINLLTNAGIQNFFFLDTAIPSLVQWSQKKRKAALPYASLFLNLLKEFFFFKIKSNGSGLTVLMVFLSARMSF